MEDPHKDAEDFHMSVDEGKEVEVKSRPQRDVSSSTGDSARSTPSFPAPDYHTIHLLDRPRDLDKMLQFIPVEKDLVVTMKFIIPAEEAYMKVYRVELPEISPQCLGKNVNKCTNELLYSSWQVIGWECQQQAHQIEESGFHYQMCYISGIEPPVGWSKPKGDDYAFQIKNLRYATSREQMNVREGNQVWKFIPSKHTDINTAWTDQYVSEKNEPPIIENDDSGQIRNADIKCIWGKFLFVGIGYTNKGRTIFDTVDKHSLAGAYMFTVVMKPALVKVNNWVDFIRDKAYDRLYNNYPALEKRYHLGMISNISPGQYIFGYDNEISFKSCCVCGFNQKCCKNYISHPMCSSL